MKKAIIFGAGKIGRGFIGQLFSESGYKVIFVDIDKAIIDKLNKEGKYPINIVSNTSNKEVIVYNVFGMNGRDTDKISHEFKQVDIIATAVGVNAIDKIAATIAEGLKIRWSQGNDSPLNIIICENMLNADKYLKKSIESKLNKSEIEILNNKIGFVEASIGRMVPTLSEDLQADNALRVYVEEYSELPVDKDGFIGEIPCIKNMVPFSPFDFFIQRKLFIHNMGHAVAAYLGFLKGYEYIWQSVEDDSIRSIVMNSYKEIISAMSREHSISSEELVKYTEDLINRFANKALGDTVERVGKDPVRKLSKSDRLIGAARLCEKHDINPINISVGIAAGFLFNPSSDSKAKEIQTYIEKNSIEFAIIKYCKISSKSLIKMIVDFYNKLKENTPLKSII